MSMFMNRVSSVKRDPAATCTRPCGKSNVAGATHIHTPTPSRRKCLMN